MHQRKKLLAIISILLLSTISVAFSKEIKTTAIQQPMNKFTKLSFSNISVNNGNITLCGITDLPEGSNINITFDVYNKDKNKHSFTGVKISSEVSQGKFTTIIIPPKTDAFKKGIYEFTATFSPFNQNSPVVNGRRDKDNINKTSIIKAPKVQDITVVIQKELTIYPKRLQ